VDEHAVLVIEVVGMASAAWHQQPVVQCSDQGLYHLRVARVHCGQNGTRHQRDKILPQNTRTVFSSAAFQDAVP